MSESFHEKFTSSKERDEFMFDNEFMSDCAFVVDDGKKKKIKVPCHKYILGCCSWEFYNLFYLMRAESSDIPITDVSITVVKKFLEFVYKETTKLDMKTVWDIVKLAKRFQVQKLIVFCDNYLLDEVKEDNIVQFIDKSAEFGFEQLQTKCVNFICRSETDYFKSPLLLNLSKEGLLSILKSGNLVKEEIDIFRFVNTWSENNCAQNGKPVNSVNKRLALGNILMHIRFGVMTLDEFTECTNNESLLTKDQIVDIFNCIGSKKERKCQFSSVRRQMTYVGNHIIFSGSSIEIFLDNSLNEHLYFSVSKDTILIGFGILGTVDVAKNQHLYMSLLNNENRRDITSWDVKMDFDGSNRINNVFPNDPIALKAGKVYIFVIEDSNNSKRDVYGLKNMKKLYNTDDEIDIKIYNDNRDFTVASIILRKINT